jgi:hypothetical protein
LISGDSFGRDALGKIFHFDAGWIQELPAKRRRRRIRDAILTIVGLLLLSYGGLYCLAGGLVFATLWWLFEFRSPKATEMARFWNGTYVEIREDGLYQHCPATVPDQDSVSLLTPWSALSIGAIEHRDAKVEVIELIDRELPPGVRKRRLEHYENMDALATEIESWTGGPSA